MPKPIIFKEGKHSTSLAILEVILIVLSLLISLASYRTSQNAFERSLREPQFEIAYQVYDTMYDRVYLSEESKNVQPIVFLSATDQEIKDFNYFEVTEDSKVVGPCTPGSMLIFEFTNIGEISAKYPTVFLQFNGVKITESLEQQLEEMFSHVEKRNHVRGLGYFSQYQWIPSENDILYPGISLLPTPLYFSGCSVEPGASLQIIISADGAQALEFTIPIEIEKSRYDDDV